MNSYIQTGLVNIIRRYIPNEINTYIESKINKIIFPTEIIHMIIRYIPKEMIRYLKNRDYYLTPPRSKNNLYNKEFDWKRLYYELYKETSVKIIYRYPKRYNNTYLNGLINRGKDREVGYYHKFKIVNFGKLYAKGENTSGELGLLDYGYVEEWIHIPIKEEVLNIVCSSSSGYSMLITTCGKVYVTGSNYTGQLGLGDDIHRNHWECIKLNEKIIQITVNNANSSFILSNNGKLFVTGCNCYGELGLGDNYSRNKWQQVFLTQSLGQQVFLTQSLGQQGTPSLGQEQQHIKLDEKIVQIECGNDHSLLLTESGNVYGAGDNNNGQLGLYRNPINKWSLIVFKSKGDTPTSKLREDGASIFYDKIVQISCQESFSMILTDIGEAFVTGICSNKCLSRTNRPIRKWRKVKLSEKIAHIICSNECADVITKNEKILRTINGKWKVAKEPYYSYSTTSF